MRVRVCIACWFLLLAALGYNARASDRTWVVYSAGDLDGRIERQLHRLAAPSDAEIRFEKSLPQESAGEAAPGTLAIELRLDPSIDAFAADLKRKAGSTVAAPGAELAREGYLIEADYAHGAVPSRLRITAATEQGLHHALLRVPDLLVIAPGNLPRDLMPRPQSLHVDDNSLSAVMADFPSFPQRGVVEGFYGTPWTHQDRLDMLRFEGAQAMNVYYYAPKDDPYHRKLWRTDYPPEAQRRLNELVQTAHENFVDFCFAISPGLSMAYSSERDFQVLVAKLASVGKLGVSCFALFLDDVPQDLQDAQDRARFKTLAQAHVYLANKLNKYLKEKSAADRLVLTPTTYTNEWGSREYLEELGAGLDRGISVVWTGPKVFSSAITAAQAREWGGIIHRPPMVWDNFPVNDSAPWRLYLAPLTGRDAHLPGTVEGLVANPMIQAQASKLALETVADYLWNAAAYDPEPSATHAVESQYGPEAPRQLAPFLKAYGTYAWEDGVFTALFQERRRPLDVAQMQSQLAAMDSALERLRYQERLAPLLRQILPEIRSTRIRLAQVMDDPAFRHLPDGTLEWNQDYEALSAPRLAHAPKLDGDFSKWQGGKVYRLEERAQVAKGAKLWNGPRDLSARVALAWDAAFLYVGVDVTDPALYQPFFGRGIENGDTFGLNLETGFRQNFFATEPTGGEYTLYFSPGDFARVKPSIFSDEDYLPPRPQPHDYMQEIRTAWKKTAKGYSGDIAIPAAYFAGGTLAPGYELGLGFSVMKVIRPTRPTDADDLQRITLQSKQDRLFRIRANNPSSYPRLVLTEGKP
jgi:hypothetical protein